MKNYSASVLVAWCALAVMLGSHTSLAQYCSVSEGFVCVGSKEHVACKENKVVTDTDAVPCGEKKLCYGSGATIDDICKPTPCSGSQYGNFSLPGVPNTYYSCYGTKEASISTCPNGTVFNTNRRMCTIELPRCTGVIQYIEDPSNCNHYYLCAATSKGQAPSRTKCPPAASRFDTYYRVCRSKYLTTCGNRMDEDAAKDDAKK